MINESNYGCRNHLVFFVMQFFNSLLCLIFSAECYKGKPLAFTSILISHDSDLPRYETIPQLGRANKIEVRHKHMPVAKLSHYFLIRNWNYLMYFAEWFTEIPQVFLRNISRNPTNENLRPVWRES